MQIPYNEDLFLLTSHVVLDYDFGQVILSILNLHILQVLVQQFINRYIFSSIKETNWLMNNRMCVLIFNIFKHLLLRKTDVLVAKYTLTWATFQPQFQETKKHTLKKCIMFFKPEVQKTSRRNNQKNLCFPKKNILPTVWNNR